MNIFPSFFSSTSRRWGRRKELGMRLTSNLLCFAAEEQIFTFLQIIHEFFVSKSGSVTTHGKKYVCERVCVCARRCETVRGRERERERERKCECGVLPPSWLSLAIPMSSKLHTFWSHMDTWMIFLRWWEWRRWREKMWWSRWWWSKPSRWYKVGTIFLSHQWTRKLLRHSKLISNSFLAI